MAKGRRRNPERPRAAEQAANSRRRKKKRVRNHTIHYILLVVFVLTIGAVLSLTTFFKIEAVTVVGTDKYPPEEVAIASGIQLEENLLRVSKPQVEERLLEKYPYIESVDIRRKLPPAIEIRITQSVPAIAAVEGDEVVMLTRGGKVLERGQLFIPPQVLAVQGIATKSVPPGGVLGEEAKDGLVMVNYLLSALESDAVKDSGFSGVTNVDVSDPRNMRIIYENRLLLKLGTEADLEHKLIFIQKALADMEPQEEGRIDVSNAQTKKWLIRKKISLEEALRIEKGDKYPAEEKDGSKPVDSSEGEGEGEV